MKWASTDLRRICFGARGSLSEGVGEAGVCTSESQNWKSMMLARAQQMSMVERNVSLDMRMEEESSQQGLRAKSVARMMEARSALAVGRERRR